MVLFLIRPQWLLYIFQKMIISSALNRPFFHNIQVYCNYNIIWSEWNIWMKMFPTTECIGNSVDFSDSKVANKLRSSKISMVKFEKETNILFDIIRNSLKVVFVKPGFCMRVFHSQKWKAREILVDITRNSLKTMFVKTRIHDKKLVQLKNISATLLKSFK